MKTKNLIEVDVFCKNHNIEISFIISLYESGLIEIITIKEIKYFEIEQIKLIEQVIQFYYDLDINVGGIETIIHLIERINIMQKTIILLQNKLQLYEGMD